MRLTLIGGGSAAFFPAIMRRLLTSNVAEGSTLTLMSVTGHRLRALWLLARRLAAAAGIGLEIRATLDRREAVADADFVIVAIAVGGVDAWESDIEIPARHGIFTPVGDTVGPGGIMRGLRNVPVLAGIARDVADLAPAAWVFNYTNPVSVATLALQTTPGSKCLSLCSCTAAPANPDWLADRVGVEPRDLALPATVAGINHCAAVTRLSPRDGRDALELARARAQEPITEWILGTYGVLPYCSDHLAEFFPQLLGHAEPYRGRAQGLAMRYGLRVEELADERRRALDWTAEVERLTAPGAFGVTIDDLSLGDDESGIVVVDLIEAIVGDLGTRHIVNVRNDGTIPNLPSDAIVEVAARVDADGVHPLAIDPLPGGFAAHLSGYVGLQRAILRAAGSGVREDLLEALLVDPSTRSVLDRRGTEILLDELLEANAKRRHERPAER